MAVSREMPPGSILSMLEITQAAIQEVGAHVTVEWVPERPGTVRSWSATLGDRVVARRAGWLAAMSLHGPQVRVLCAECAAKNDIALRNCIAAIDALRGRTCKENP